ncbi:hypothetical protein GCM10009716_11480 [Streptomyces sodiiphilus]|uniref:Uncharacterized protein n=1 Tax=Streptomyces sodiiphilus TaxID=226217 RepID=A0ABN2NXQ2_9ACTN
MDTATAVVTIAWVFIVKLSALLAIWLRLRWRARQELTRRRHVSGVAAAIGRGGRLELDEEFPDGHRVRMTITRPENAEEKQAA